MNFDDEINEIITTDNESVNKVLWNYAKSLMKQVKNGAYGMVNPNIYKNEVKKRLVADGAYDIGKKEHYNDSKISNYVDMKNIYENALSNEGKITEKEFNEYAKDNGSIIASGKDLYKKREKMENLSNQEKLRGRYIHDKYKHAYLNCKAAQRGSAGNFVASMFSDAKEAMDLYKESNSVYESKQDQYANKLGRFLGTKYKNEDCDYLVQKYITKYMK